MLHHVVFVVCRLQRRNSQNLPEEEKEKQTLRVKAAKVNENVN